MIILLFIIFLCLFNRYRRQKGTTKLLLFGYLVSSAFSLMKYLFQINIDESVDSLAILYYIVCIYILLFPYLKRGTYTSQNYYFPPRLIRIISFVLIIGGLVNLYYSVPRLFTIQTLVNNISDIRQAYYQGMDILNLGPQSLLEVLSNVLLYLSYLSPICCVYYYLRGNYKLAILLFLSSLARPVNLMTIGEREAILIWVSNYLFAYFFFLDEFTELARKKISKIGLLVSSPLLFFFILITFSRFSDSDGGIMSSIFTYAGDQPFNFSKYFTQLSSQALGGKLNFSYLFPEDERLTGLITDHFSSSIEVNAFASIVGSYFLDFGYWTIFVVFVVSIIFSVLFKVIARRTNGKLPFAHFFVLLFMYQILFIGIFYNDISSVYYVGCFFFVLGCLLLYSFFFTKEKGQCKNDVCLPQILS